MAVTPVYHLNNPVNLNFSGGINIKGEYDPLVSYVMGDAVSYLGSSYAAIQASTGNLPTDAMHWQLLSKGLDKLGGTTDQALLKASNGDYDTKWKTIDKAFVGLDKVNNTSDASKPISTAQQNALNLKADKTEIPAKNSELLNDSEFITLTEVPEETDPIWVADRPNYAKTSQLPTKNSQLENDSEFITLEDVPVVPEETDPVFSQWLLNTPPLYSFTEEDPVFTQWLNTNPFSSFLTSESDPVFGQWLAENPLSAFLTEETDPIWIADKPLYALKTEIPEMPIVPTKNSQLENDSEFITLEDVPEPTPFDAQTFELELARKTSGNSYMELVKTGDILNGINYWSDSSKATKLFTKTLTYIGDKLTTVSTKDEATNKTLTQTIAYIGDEVESITKVIS